AIPTGRWAFRDRKILAQSPSQIQWVTVHRDGRTFVVKAGRSPEDFTHWRMVEPVDSAVDAEATSRLGVMLANLRAESLVTDQPGDDAAYGLDAPSLTATWASLAEATRPARQGAAPGSSPPTEETTFLVGNEVPGRRGVRYARVSGNPMVFT